MHKNVKNRLVTVVLCLVSIGVGVFLILNALEDNITFFYTPSQLDKISSAHRPIRVGGLVQHGSVVYDNDKCITFVMEDYDKSVLKAKFCGTLPIIFREGQGVILRGTMQDDGERVFVAQELLAKHDEKYMPPPNYKKQ